MVLLGSLEPLVFVGAITSGVGKHVELHVPGRDEMPQAPADWPSVLCRGSLNVRILVDGYPALFLQQRFGNTVRSLDTNCYPCAFEISQSQFGNNMLLPNPSEPRKGSAQVWKAVLTTNDQNIPCWVLRRYRSGLTDQLELLSDRHLRTAYHLENGQRVTVHLLHRETAA